MGHTAFPKLIWGRRVALALQDQVGCKWRRRYPQGKIGVLLSRKEAEMDAEWVRTIDVQDRKKPVMLVATGQAMTALRALPCLSSSRRRRACSERCPTRVCAVGGGSPALPTLPVWSPACPVMCSSPAPAPFPPAHCPPAASTSTPTCPAAVAPAPAPPLATASQRRNVSPGPWGWQGSPRG